MTLAQRMARIARNEQVRRYARDAAVEQAIRNYLAIALRAQGVPGLLGQQEPFRLGSRPTLTTLASIPRGLSKGTP